MEFLSFEIKNFKGIDHLKIDLSRNPVGSVYTLVGLNESGKTTVLEAISFFGSKGKELESLYQPVFQQKNVNELVPMKNKANFNGKIEISANISLNDEDKAEILNHSKKKLKFILDPVKLGSTFSITKTLEYEDSIYKSTGHTWNIDTYGKPTRGKKTKYLHDHSREKWGYLINFIASNLPTILYFPTFLFDFPSRIFLQEEEKELHTNTYYRSIIQDILDSLNNELSIEKHIIKRAVSDNDYDKESLDVVLNKMSNIVSKTVFERWNEIFERRISNKKVKINYHIDKPDDDEVPDIGNSEEIQTKQPKVSIEFKITEGDSLYSITDRSLGFRWFFCFLLFTQFRSYRKSQQDTLFLLDEPASNLHSKAQKQLLDSFLKITENSGKIIYSTHSHYMINPNWLENTFIVNNEGLN